MHALLLGLSLGLGAGMAPGPLMAVVLRSTLSGGFAAGARVACGPLLTDLPIIVFAVLLAAELPHAALSALGIGGGLFAASLGVEALRDDPEPVEAAGGAPAPAGGGGDLRRGAVTNLLNPHPWIFWVSVGAPVLAQGGVPEGAVFLVAFYALLIGAKLVFAALLSAGHERLSSGRGHTIALRLSGFVLLAAGAALVIEGTRSL